MIADHLQMLQYNIRKEKNSTMAPLVHSDCSDWVDIIAVQEP